MADDFPAKTTLNGPSVGTMKANDATKPPSRKKRKKMKGKKGKKRRSMREIARKHAGEMARATHGGGYY